MSWRPSTASAARSPGGSPGRGGACIHKRHGLGLRRELRRGLGLGLRFGDGWLGAGSEGSATGSGSAGPCRRGLRLGDGLRLGGLPGSGSGSATGSGSAEPRARARRRAPARLSTRARPRRLVRGPPVRVPRSCARQPPRRSARGRRPGCGRPLAADSGRRSGSCSRDSTRPCQARSIFAGFDRTWQRWPWTGKLNRVRGSSARPTYGQASGSAPVGSFRLTA